MFNNLKVNETPERGYKDGHGNNTTHNSYLNSSVGRGDGGTSTPEGSLQNSGKFQTPQHRRHRSNSTAPSTPAGTIPRSRPSPSGCDVSADSYTRRQLDGNLHICLVKTLASEFDPYLHNSPSYSMPYPRYANGSSDDAWTVGYSAWEGGVRHSRHLGYYGGASETNGKCGYASASQRYYSEERRVWSMIFLLLLFFIRQLLGDNTKASSGKQHIFHRSAKPNTKPSETTTATL